MARKCFVQLLVAMMDLVILLLIQVQPVKDKHQTSQVKPITANNKEDK